MPKGSLALVGSGEYLPAMASLEQSLIQDGVKNGKKARFIQIPTAAGQESADRIAFWRELGRVQGERLGVEVEFLEILNRQDAQDKELATLIADSALIYLSGGDPHHLADSLAGTPVLMPSIKAGLAVHHLQAAAQVRWRSLPIFQTLDLVKRAQPQALTFCLK